MARYAIAVVVCAIYLFCLSSTVAAALMGGRVGAEEACVRQVGGTGPSMKIANACGGLAVTVKPEEDGYR